MKKLIVSLFTAAALMMPGLSHAADVSGLYLAPKFVLNMQHVDTAQHSVSLADLSGEKDSTAAGAAFAIGYDFKPRFDVPVRAELEFGAFGGSSKEASGSYYKGSIAGVSLIMQEDLSAKTSVRTLLANVYWDITTWNGFTPYVGAGIGAAFVKTKINSSAGFPHFGISESATDSHSDTVLAGQVGLGCSYAISKNFSIDLGYRFLMMDDRDDRYLTKTGLRRIELNDNYAHQVMLGLRVTF